VFNHPCRVAFIGNALPRRCGIATFTTDLELAVSALGDVAGTAIFPMRDPGRDYEWPASVRQHIDPKRDHLFVGASMLPFVDYYAPYTAYTHVEGERSLPLNSPINPWSEP